MKKKTARKRLTKLHLLAGIAIFIVAVIIVVVCLTELRTYRQHVKLLHEIKALHFSSSEPQQVSFEQYPIDAEQPLSSWYPGARMTLPIKQTTLVTETNSIRQTLQNAGFKVEYSTGDTTNVIGRSGSWFINVSVEYNDAALPLVSTGQTSSYNGEPLFTQPGPDFTVNDLQITLEDTSSLKAAR